METSYPAEAYPPQTLNVLHNLSSSGSISMDPTWQYLNVGGNLINAGSISPQYINVGGNLRNSGSINVPGNISVATSLLVDGTLNNIGTLNIGSFNQGGANIVAGQLKNSGSIYLAESNINLTSQPQGITTLNGSMELDKGSSMTSGGKNALSSLRTVNGSLFLYLQGSALSITPVNSSQVLTINGGISLGDGPGIAVTGNVLNNGSLTLSDDQQDAGLSPSTFSSTGRFTNNGRIQIGGSFSNDQFQALTLINYSGISIDKFASAAAQTVTNAGTISITGVRSALAIGTGTVQSQAATFQEFDDGVLNEVIDTNTHGTINTTGPADLSGTLDILVNAGYTPAPGATFEILTFAPGELTGAFSQVLYRTGDRFSVTYDNYDGHISVTALAPEAVPEPTTRELSFLALAAGLCLAAAGKRNYFMKFFSNPSPS